MMKDLTADAVVFYPWTDPAEMKESAEQVARKVKRKIVRIEGCMCFFDKPLKRADFDKLAEWDKD